MHAENPYAAPAVEPSPLNDAEPPGGVWRSGNELVVARTARLPERCIKCNTAVGVAMISRRLYHAPDWTMWLLCMCLCYPPLGIVWLLFQFLVSTRAAIELGLCDDCRNSRRRTAVLSWALLFVGIGGMVGSVTSSFLMLGGFPAPALSIGQVMAIAVLGGVLILASFFLDLFRGQLVEARRIDERQVRLTGVCPAYLDQLPEAP